MRLGIDEVARALGVTPEVIRRWVAQGKIPALVVNRQTVFDHKEIGRWAAERNVTLVDTGGTESVAAPQTTSLVEGMRRGGLHKGIPGATVADALDAAIDRIALPADVSHDELYRAVLEREQLASTGVGRGVAIPHVRAPPPGYAGSAFVATCLLAHPVEFGALDGQPVFVLFVTVSPSVKTHLELLSQLSYCLRDEAFLTLLRRDPAQADLLREAERRIAQLPHPR